MPREHAQLTAAKKSYGNAKAVGNHEEEARLANAIGDMLKKRGEYVAALQWLRIDYDLSVKYLPQKHCLPTCQSLGELYLRLECFKEALIYQGQALAKVNIGDVLDSVDNFKGALDAFGSGGNGSDLIIWQIRLDPRISNTT